MARQLLEFIVAHLRAASNVAIYANMCGESPRAIAKRMFSQSVIGGLQGPTISPVITSQGDDFVRCAHRCAPGRLGAGHR